MRTIAVLTGTRADYGLLRGLLRAVEGDGDLQLRVIVTGTHLSEEFGETGSEIAADGFAIAATVPIWTGGDRPMDAAADVSRAIGRFAAVLTELAPDVLVVLGDRLEAFAAAAAATVLAVPVAHIHGGELTEGAMDDVLRHAITKMSFLHFTSTADHRRRVIQLGEEPNRVFFHGAPIVDALTGMDLLSPSEVERRFDIRLPTRTALVTFHPATMDVSAPELLVEEMLAGLTAVDDLHMVFTGSNSDIGTAGVRSRIAEFVAANRGRADYVESFGQLGYLSAMSAASAVVGNSSSTVLEAPVLGVPSVLIGDRQTGRPRAASVRTPRPDRDAIAAAVQQAIDDEVRAPATELFGPPGFAARVAGTLRDADIPRPPRKSFYDLEGRLDS